MNPSECPLGQNYFYDPCGPTIDPFWVTVINGESAGGRYRCIVPGSGSGSAGFTSAGSTPLTGFAATIFFSVSFGATGGGSFDPVRLYDRITGSAISVQVHAECNIGPTTGKVSVRFYDNIFSPPIHEEFYHNGAMAPGFFFSTTITVEVRRNGSITEFYLDGILKATSANNLSSTPNLGFGIQNDVGFRVVYGEVEDMRWTGASFANPCQGFNPLYAALLPNATGKISHARILLEHRGEAGAQLFHNLMKEKTA